MQVGEDVLPLSGINQVCAPTQTGQYQAHKPLEGAGSIG